MFLLISHAKNTFLQITSNHQSLPVGLVFTSFVALRFKLKRPNKSHMSPIVIGRDRRHFGQDECHVTVHVGNNARLQGKALLL